MGGRDAIYLDNHSTTPVDPRVVRVVCEVLRSTIGNPNSSGHIFGADARRILDDTRARVATLVGAEASDVVLTSGATEAIQLAISHAKRTRAPGRPLRVISTRAEHRAVLAALDTLVESGAAEVSFLPLDRAGRLDLEDLAQALGEGADLVCAMAANNEVGTLYPIEQVARIVAEADALLLVDATQTVGKVPVSTRAWGLDYLTLSAHKFYGPKGAGALVLGTGLQWSEPHGGTPNVPAIAGLGEACRLRVQEMDEDEARIADLRDRLQDLLRARIPGLVVNGDPSARLSGNLHVSVPGVPNDAVLSRLHDRVALSTGSACTSGTPSPSHVLVALGLREELIEGALRIGVGKFTTDEEVEQAADLVARAVFDVRGAMDGHVDTVAKG